MSAGLVTYHSFACSLFPSHTFFQSFCRTGPLGSQSKGKSTSFSMDFIVDDRWTGGSFARYPRPRTIPPSDYPSQKSLFTLHPILCVPAALHFITVSTGTAIRTYRFQRVRRGALVTWTLHPHRHANLPTPVDIHRESDFRTTSTTTVIYVLVAMRATMKVVAQATYYGEYRRCY